MSGSFQLDNATAVADGTMNCWQIFPQSSDHNYVPTSIAIQIEPGYSLNGATLQVWKNWYPMSNPRWLLTTVDDCCSANLNQSWSVPFITISYNGSYSLLAPFTITWSGSSALKTKYSLGIFEGTVVIIFAPVVVLVFSMFTFRKGRCDSTGKGRRLSRKTPLSERICAGIAAGIGLVFFFLLGLRAFG